MLFVVTINYNNLNGLKKTINSYSNIGIDDVTYILVDGKSNDGSVELINESNFHTNIIKIIEKDDGTYHAMNKAIEKIYSMLNTDNDNFLIFMNSGDEFYNISSEILKKCKKNAITVGKNLTDSGDIDIRHNINMLNWSIMPFCHQSAIYNCNIIKKNDIFFKTSTWSYNDYRQIVLLSRVYGLPKYIEDIVCIYEQQTSTGISRSSWKYRFEKIKILCKFFYKCFSVAHYFIVKNDAVFFIHTYSF